MRVRQYVEWIYDSMKVWERSIYGCPRAWRCNYESIGMTSSVNLLSSTFRQAPLLKFQIFKLPSRPPVISLRPLGSKVMAVSSMSPWQRENCMVFSPVSRSQTLTTPPWQPLTTWRDVTTILLLAWLGLVTDDVYMYIHFVTFSHRFCMKYIII